MHAYQGSPRGVVVGWVPLQEAYVDPVYPNSDFLLRALYESHMSSVFLAEPSKILFLI